MTKPTIGRIVHYRLPKDAPEINGSREFPAIIVRVIDDETVSLRVFNDGSEDLTCTNVKLQEDGGDPGDPDVCWWPEESSTLKLGSKGK